MLTYNLNAFSLFCNATALSSKQNSLQDLLKVIKSRSCLLVLLFGAVCRWSQASQKNETHPTPNTPASSRIRLHCPSNKHNPFFSSSFWIGFIGHIYSGDLYVSLCYINIFILILLWWFPDVKQKLFFRKLSTWFDGGSTIAEFILSSSSRCC